MSGALKKATGLTGLAVATNPHHSLSLLYKKILGTLQKMPDCSAYKKHTQLVIEERSCIIQNTPDVAALEKKIGCGQVEELIIQAENELMLARKMLGWKPWEPLVREAPSNQWAWPPATN